MSNILVVGAGFTGATIARELAEAGHKIDIVDERKHIGGNAFDYYENGIRVHAYGPHIFHTSSKEVFDWMSQFTEWEDYYHQVMAVDTDGEYVPFPPNRITGEKYDFDKEKLLDVFFRPYTRKMWGMELEEISPDVINRVPMDFETNNNLYFKKDIYQAMPKDGYTNMFKKILDHPNIHLTLGESIKPGEEIWYDYTFNCSPIDSWYGYKHGELPYRSIKFTNQFVPIPNILPTATVNFSSPLGKWTRVTEWKKFPNHGDNPIGSMLTFEQPCDYKDNNMERYYPVKDVNGVNREIYKKYAAENHGKMEFVGRCGQYVYIDMHQAVMSALQITKRYKHKNTR